MPTILDLTPHAVGNGPYHPALKVRDDYVFYWPNVIYSEASEALDHAKAAYMDAVLAAQGVIESWNILTW